METDQQHTRRASLTGFSTILCEGSRTFSQAVFLSQDGLALGASRGLDQADAEHLAALAAGFSRSPAARAVTSAAAKRGSRSSR